MKARKILKSEISELMISSLPTKPTAPSSAGGRGYGAKEMKEAFDKLPLFIIDRFNNLMDDIVTTGNDSLSASVMTGLKDAHTLKDLFSDISSGEFGAYCMILGESLISHIIGIKSDLASLNDRIQSLEDKKEVNNA